MNEAVPEVEDMSDYEQKRWAELQAHWEKKAKSRKQLLPPHARKALEAGTQRTKDTASRTGKAVAERTPERVKDAAGKAADVAGKAAGAALVPTLHNVVQLLELLNDWVVELTNPESVLRYHREKGREVESLADLQRLELEHLEELTNHRKALKWRTVGLGEGAIVGGLAMIPVPVVGSVAAIGLDIVVMRALTSAIATRICYAYGYDAADPEMRHIIDRMTARAYQNQIAKAGSMKKAADAFDAAKGRVNWNQKLRDNHRLMAAVEKLLKSAGNGKHVPVQNARMGMPVISILAGAATNQHLLGDTALQARHFGATMLLAEKYGLELPANLRRDLDAEDDGATA
ncbi:EcsC family protein [Rhodococcus kroppenstedtii]|uniref:EcsC family protein n=1 Tax=Rhodococcoides kroppenstedtii TaxID=293050 RepID=UPI001C9B9D80|nr:EcsC family protein [Rhodococcus kroppenstedtii]MBY6438117.1 EcsC family protein [Rhodococcus kroppenstedtii]